MTEPTRPRNRGAKPRSGSAGRPTPPPEPAAKPTPATPKPAARSTPKNTTKRSAKNPPPASQTPAKPPSPRARPATSRTSHANGHEPGGLPTVTTPSLADLSRINGHHPSLNGSAVNGSAVNGSVVNGSAPGAPSATASAGDESATAAEPYRAESPSGTRPATREPDVWDERVAGFLGFVRRRLTGQYEVDEFGFDPELTSAIVHPPLRALYQHYFRVTTTGVENLPEGGALIVANHSGALPLDALMLSMAVHDETTAGRHLRLLGADLVFRMPFLSEIARKAGSTLACNPDAERLLRNGEYVGVFPEGFKGIGKPYRERYKLQRFGRGGFVSAALRTGTPIVPAAIVGAEEIYPIIANLTPLAKVLGVPYVPVTPLFPWLGPLGLLPLPSKWLIEFGEPIDTAPLSDEADDPIVVFNLADQVRETIQHTLHTLLERRPDPFG